MKRIEFVSIGKVGEDSLYRVIGGTQVTTVTTTEDILKLEENKPVLHFQTIDGKDVYANSVVLVAIDDENVSYYQDSVSKKLYPTKETEVTVVGRRIDATPPEPIISTTSGCSHHHQRY